MKSSLVTRIRPLRTRTARRALLAPDLARYLDRRNVDLTVTDQVQAIQVRVRRGLEVFRKHATAALDATRFVLVNRCLALLICAVIAPTAFNMSLWIVGSTFSLLIVVFAFAVVRVLQDRAQLATLLDRFQDEEIDAAQTIDEVLAFADSLLSAATALGAAEDAKP